MFMAPPGLQRPIPLHSRPMLAQTSGFRLHRSAPHYVLLAFLIALLCVTLLYPIALTVGGAFVKTDAAGRRFAQPPLAGISGPATAPAGS